MYMAVPNQLEVTNAGSTQFIGTWTRTANVNGLPAWLNDADNTLIISGFLTSANTLIQWGIGIAPLNFINGSGLWYFTNPAITVTGNNEWPDEDFTWSNAFGVPGQLPLPTISIYTPVPSEPTFGLPPDVVALITSRFGSVARFLRLRNQGQI